MRPPHLTRATLSALESETRFINLGLTNLSAIRIYFYTQASTSRPNSQRRHVTQKESHIGYCSQQNPTTADCLLCTVRCCCCCCYCCCVLDVLNAVRLARSSPLNRQHRSLSVSPSAVLPACPCGARRPAVQPTVDRGLASPPSPRQLDAVSFVSAVLLQPKCRIIVFRLTIIYSSLFTRKQVAIIEKQKRQTHEKIKHKNIGTWYKEYAICYKLARYLQRNVRAS